MSDIVRHTLKTLMEAEGDKILHYPEKLKVQLLHKHPDEKRAIYVIIASLEEHLVEALMANTGFERDFRTQLSRQLYNTRGIAEEFGLWVVDLWVDVLNLQPNLVETAYGLDLVLMKGGSFQMGNLWDGEHDFEKPVHQVTLNDFYIGKYLVTNTEYAKFLNEYGTIFVKEGEFAGQLMVDAHEWGMKEVDGTWVPQEGFEKHPAIFVTWFGAMEFCRFYGFRLPTEAEWEYAARSGGLMQRWSGTDNELELPDYAWYSINSNEQPQPVDAKRPNQAGIHDMSGNVWEWCSDWYDENYYSVSPEHNPKGPPEGRFNVLRGGSWFYAAEFIRTVSRNWSDPTYTNGSRGFRVVKDV
ncbi:MAG: hypothetical protein D6675_08825 [Gemmatimonadetes bacterium]|nr:MAG: hypothetical protein D6675_08825 [Gemmatimonadota bacterium]